MVRVLDRQEAKHLPTMHNAVTSKIKNDKVRRVLQLDTAKYQVNSASNLFQ